MRSILVGVAVAGLLALQACSPIVRVIDTPKDGTQVDLAVDQGMQVRWSNLSPDEGTWVLEAPPKSAVTLVGKTEQPPAGGGIGLDIFDFQAKQKGVERITFVYKHKDGSPSAPEERISVDLAVS